MRCRRNPNPSARVLQMVLEWMQKVDVLEYYSDVSIASASEVFPLPAVMRCRGYVQRPRRRSRMLVSKRNILLRDRHVCQCAPPFNPLLVMRVRTAARDVSQLRWSDTQLRLQPRMPSPPPPPPRGT